jgi:dTDP-glucose 4,6-dehydratase
LIILNFNRNILVTGGAGFIGSHVLRLLLNKYPDRRYVNYDSLSYAGNLENLKDVEHLPNYQFVKGDIRDFELLQKTFKDFAIDGVIHLAAESHVDRSIENPLEFIQTNIFGTVTLLNVAKQRWNEGKNYRFYHISTDEVYGSLGMEGHFTETSAYDPRSPYSASKASSDHFVRAWFHTYGLPVVISNCSNNYGPNQFPEKLIPLMIRNIRLNEPLPVYGKGENVRDWLWVGDHAKAIDVIFERGEIGATYNIGGNNEWKNIDIVHHLCQLLDKKLNREDGTSAKLISFVKDRAGHDLRYAIDASFIKSKLGWEPEVQFEEGIEKTVDWYLENEAWVEKVCSGEYLKYYEKYYSHKFNN